MLPELNPTAGNKAEKTLKTSLNRFFFVFIISIIGAAYANWRLAAKFGALSPQAFAPCVIPLLGLLYYAARWRPAIPERTGIRARFDCTLTVVILIAAAVICFGFAFTPFLVRSETTISDREVLGVDNFLSLHTRTGSGQVFEVSGVCVLFPGALPTSQAMYEWKLQRDQDVHICLTTLTSAKQLRAPHGLSVPHTAVAAVSHFRRSRYDGNCSQHMAPFVKPILFERLSHKTEPLGLFLRVPAAWDTTPELTHTDYMEALELSGMTPIDRKVMFVEPIDEPMLADLQYASTKRALRTRIMLYITLFPAFSIVFPAVVIYTFLFPRYLAAETKRD